MKRLKFKDVACKKKMKDVLKNIFVVRDDADVETKVKSLAEWLDADPEDVEVLSDTDFEVDGKHYIVADYDTAKDLAVERARDLLEDMGCESLSPDFLEYVIDNFVEEDGLEDLIYEDVENLINNDYDDDDVMEFAEDYGLIDDNDYERVYTGDINDLRERLIEATADKKKQEGIDYFRDYFGSTEELGDWLIEQGLLDYDKIAEYIVDEDRMTGYGFGIQLAGYDSEENELGNDLYAYRDSKKRMLARKCRNDSISRRKHLTRDRRVRHIKHR